MENCMRLKMKRKEFDDSTEEVFADFCLSSPAFKIRRLDADMPSVIEEDVAGIPLRYEQPIPESAVSNGATNQLNPLDVEEVPFVPENNEKAVVLFKPMNNPLFFSLNNLSVDPNLISSFKNQALLHTNHKGTRPGEEEDEADGNWDKEGLNACKAIIPWSPSHQPLYQRPILSPQAEVSDTMESEDMELASMMEIEDDSSASNSNQSRPGEGVQQYHQWQQQQQHQHCMIPEPPHTYTTTPIVWYR